MSAGLTLAEAITDLVAEKRAVGYKYHAEAQVLVRFEAFCRSEFPGADRHCCIEATGVLAMAQSSNAGSTGPVENYDKPGIRGLPSGFWVGR